ncbi:uncharacterized protein LOC143260682 [Megalopta genalis]|uniref:uncharacterized protein LOC143260682 n=1 Tax=Megalopta genalis TaxID=115081 RepID=UPI003FD5BA9D
MSKEVGKRRSESPDNYEAELSSRYHRQRSRSSREMEKRRDSVTGPQPSTHRNRSREGRSDGGRSSSMDDGTSGIGESDFAKLTAALTDAIRAGSKRAKQVTNDKIIPGFDPEVTDASVLEWLRKINELAVVCNWEETDKVFYAVGKLQGIAKQWYDSLTSPPLVWDVFSELISTQFAGEENFGKLLEVAVGYKSVPGQSLQAYCFEKLKKINKLNLVLPEEKLVECVVYGIHDDHIRMNLMNLAKKKTIPELMNCLDLLTIELSNRSNVTKGKRDFSDREDIKRTTDIGKGAGVRNSVGTDGNGALEKGRTGVKCGYCGILGHTDNKEGASVSGENVGNHRAQALEVKVDPLVKSLKKCVVESREKTCTIDLGSECSIIRESFARQLNLTLKDTNKVLSGFNNSEVVPIGRSKISIFIDNIPFKVRVLVVADDQLSKEIIICRDVLNKAGTRAITDSSGVTFTCGGYRREVLEINMTCYGERRPIVETDICCDSSVGDKSRLLELINEYRNCVALNHNELGRTSVTELKIELLDDEPVFHKPYRLSQADKEIVRNIVAELEMNDIIRPSKSPYASPVVLVKKKTGDTHVTIDYRALNRKTKLMKFPLPIIEDQIDQLFGKKVFTSLDLKSGFYQLPIHPDSIEKTAFVTPDGQWEFLRMPFGLVNAPSVFQAMIKRVVKELALVYIDDVLIASEGLEEAYEQLKAVLKALDTNNLTLNLAKCRFFQYKIDYLGREISEEELRPGLYKIEAVSRAAEPRNVKEVAPLTKLLRKNVPWEWGTKESEVVKEVKRILVDRPVLAIYSPSLTTKVHTDASAIGLGAILFQKHGGVALKTFRVYLLGIKFTDFTFDIVYRPGTKLAHVDYLSRNPVECCAIDITEAEWIKVAQLQDPSLEVVRKILESKDIQPETKQYFDKYVVRYCHDEQGHFAVDGTLDKVREHYWFKGMRRFVTKTTRKSPTQLLFGFKPRSLAGAKLLAEIQDTLDQLDLQKMREAAKAATDADQERQKKRFDTKRYAPPKYAVGDVVMVAAKHGATGESRKLLPVAKGPFKVTAVLPDDRYEVLDLRDMRKSRNSRTVVAVDKLYRPSNKSHWLMVLLDLLETVLPSKYETIVMAPDGLQVQVTTEHVKSKLLQEDMKALLGNNL